MKGYKHIYTITSSGGSERCVEADHMTPTKEGDAYVFYDKHSNVLAITQPGLLTSERNQRAGRKA